MKLFLAIVCLAAAWLPQPSAAEPVRVESKEVSALRAKAEAGDAVAQASLGLMCFKGQGVAKDEVEAVKWWRQAADQGEADAQFQLGAMYANGRGVPEDKVEAAKWYRKAADQGDARAQSNLGAMYADGRGVPKDEAEAVKWYLKAAERGFATAQSNLGSMYVLGRGVPKDEAEAVKWFRMAAEQGDAPGQSYLGSMYSLGAGVLEDDVEAVKWLRKAADQGYASAQSILAAMYFEGRGVPKNEAEAVKWFRMAAEQGDATAQFYLGNMCDIGRGVPKDDAEAVKWYRMAADQGHATAQSNLGAKYSQGAGVSKDYLTAYKWRLLAAAQGDKTARQAAPALERLMTREQIAEGQKLAREFQPRTASSADSPDPREGIAQSSPESTGTGFFITPDGYFITNQHVAGEDATVRVLTAAGSLPARVVRVDKANDLALLKVNGTFTALPVIASRGARLGATVATVGFPNIGLQGFAPKLAKGEIASLAGAQDDARHFQISAPIQPGNSGGALVDECGNVIGVVVAKLSQQAALATSGTLAENVNYAAKSSYLLSFLESVPEVAAQLKEPNTQSRPFDDVVKDVEQATVLVLVY